MVANPGFGYGDEIHLFRRQHEITEQTFYRRRRKYGGLKQSKIGPVQSGKPWQNGVAESFIGKLRDECLNLEWFYSPAGARVVVEMYRKHYNRERPR